MQISSMNVSEIKSDENSLRRNQQLIVKKYLIKHSVTFFYLLCLNSHNNNKKLKTMAKAKKAKKAAKKAKKAAKKKK
jgi:hypothetical protein